MCGINGFNFQDRPLIEAMIGRTRHRGPDSTGIYCDEGMSIGHNLLAITETPDRSAQPVVSRENGTVLSYNGEIYNYVELRENLKKRGSRFETESDTEVLATGLEAEGARFLERINGMFALAYYNKKTSEILLARDTNGIKPLYYYWKNGRLIFSSEIKGIFVHDIHRRLDWDAFHVFLDIGYVPGQQTLVQDVFKVRPGELIVFDLDKKEMRRKWFLQHPPATATGPVDMEELRSTLRDAVEAHTMGRRPVGLYLSGGLDSSILLSELCQSGKVAFQTFTTRFEAAPQALNEDAELADRMHRQYGIQHHDLLVTENDFVGAVEDVIQTIEEPRHNNSLAAYYLLAKSAANDVIVTLSGDGGDELFGGYPKYFQSRRMSEYYSRYPARMMNLIYTCRDKVARRTDLRDWLNLDDPLTRWTHFNRFTFSRDDRFFNFDRKSCGLPAYVKAQLPPGLVNGSDDMENTLMDLDRHFWLADECFIRNDKIGMRFGMEARFPFLDRRLVELARKIPSGEKLRMRASRPKSLLRQAYAGRLPDYILQKRKSGWRAPVETWVSSRLGEKIKGAFSGEFYEETSHIFNFDAIQKEVARDPGMMWMRKGFSIFSFQIWARHFKITTGG